MKPFQTKPRLAGLAALLLAMLIAGVPAARATAPAMPQAQASPLTVAVAVAASPATGHLFAISLIGQGTQQGQSWVTMLDARSGKVLRTTPVPLGARKLAVDDRVQRVFVLSGGEQSFGLPIPPVLTMLDARTASPVGTIDLRKGTPAVWSLWVASRLGLLFVVTNTDQAHPDKSPNMLRVFDTKTGRPVHTLQVPAGKPTLAVYEGSSRLYVATSTASAVQLYDLKQWTLLKTIPPPAFSPFTYSPVWAVDESLGLLALVSSAQGNRLSLLDAASGMVRRVIQLPATPNSTNLVLDQQSKHAFIIGGGEYNMDTGVGQDGAVRSIDLATGTLLHTAPVGVIAYQALIDPITHHLLVLSEDRTASNGQVSLASSLVSMLDTRTGARLRSTKIPFTDVLDVASIVVDGRAGFAYVNATGMPGPQETLADHNLNNIVILDVRTGALVRTVLLPQLAKATPTPVSEDLTAVAASSAHDVWGAGGTVMQHWDGTQWSVVPIASTATSTDSLLLGVVAISARDAWAVGRVNISEQETRTLIEHWDGVHWHVVAG